MDIITPNSPKNQYGIINADILEWAETYEGSLFHAALLDPPYHLTITKRFGKPGSKPAKVGVYNRASKGFMNQSWDGTDDSGLGIAFRPETWAALSQHLHPGGFIVAFAGTRGYHRMACAMEDSGLIIHPAMVWTFLSGFPKATQISNQIDRAAGVTENEIEWRPIAYPDSDTWGTPNKNDDGTNHNPSSYTKAGNIKDGMRPHKLPATPLAQTWTGHRYGLQALKPALEFIAVAQKPYEGRPVDCITRTGAGAWNIDKGRIRTNDQGQALDASSRKITNRTSDKFSGVYTQSHQREGDVFADANPLGRWPANLLLDDNTCKVLRLMYNIPDEIKQIIREYFNDYSEMRTVQAGIPDVSEPPKNRQGEVLQERMLRGLDEREQPRRESPNEGEASHPRDNRENKGNQEEEGREPLREIPILEGGQTQDEGVLGGTTKQSTPTRAGGIPINGNEEQPLLRAGAPTDNGSSPGESLVPRGEDSPQEWDKGRQPAGEPRSTQQFNSQDGASADNQRSEGIEKRKRTTESGSLEIAEPLIPKGWLKYFEDTGKVVRYGGAALLDRQSGETRPGHFPLTASNGGIWGNGQNPKLADDSNNGYNDSGGASRMFFRSDWQYEILEQLANADPLKYEPKVSTAEGNVGAEAFYWAITPKGFERVTYEEWQSLDPKKRAEGNIHPTKKPISLCKYLCELISPPDAYAPRRLLVPFAGSGSEMAGAILSGGFEEVVGIDSNPDYHAIAEARLAWWSQWPGWGQTDVDKILASLADEAPAEQLSLFQEAAL